MAEDKKFDAIERGLHGRNIAGTATYIGLRALDPLLQYAILKHGLGAGVFSALGTTTTAMGAPTNTGIALIDHLGLSPYRLALLSMSGATALKHAIWGGFISNEPLPPSFAAIVGIANNVLNSINSLLFICAATSPAFGRGEGPGLPGYPSAELILGSLLVAIGLAAELGSEAQRHVFKQDPANKGKCYTGGLFGLSRHVNYFGYTLWRTGFALAGGGWIWASLTAAMYSWDFNSRAIPVLDEYCDGRYGDLWKDYKKRTPYQFAPFLY